MSSLKNILVIIGLCLVMGCNYLQAENIVINSELKKKIMQSSLKETLNIKNGKKITVYLYASDEVKKEEKMFSCLHGGEKKWHTKSGHYYVYLYDEKKKDFLDHRVAVFPEFEGDITNFGIEGGEIFLLKNFGSGISDILLISQPGGCKGNYFEAYGFNEKIMNLERYYFFTNEKNDMFYGRIIPNNDSDKLYAFTMFHHQIQELTVSLSNKEKEILIANYEAGK